MGSFENVLSSVNEDCRLLCPECSQERKKKNVKTLSVTITENGKVYHCHHCGASGKVPYAGSVIREIKPVRLPPETEPGLVERFLKSRGIEPSKVMSYPVIGGRKFFRGQQDEIEAVGFVYGTPGEITAVKWRGLETKAFTQDGAAQEFYGIHQLPKDVDQLVICEGECDALALNSIGIPAVSVPNGAPQKVSRKQVDPSDDGKYGYVWAARETIEKCSRIILATDMDDPGEALAEELARRIGRAKCWRVTFPGKDANDTLLEHGAEALQKAVEEAQPLPLEGVYLASDYGEDVDELYDNGFAQGVSTGIPEMDELYTVLPGQLSVVTGLPGSGKSEWVDQVCVNLAKNHGWRFAYASFENPPHLHIAKLAEKVVGKPFFQGPTPRMTREEKREALDFIGEHFAFLQSHDGAPATVASIIDRTKQSVMRLGVRGLVIDPYNYLDVRTEKEHNTISDMLTQVIMFAKAHGLHVWFVAHPAKMYPDQSGRSRVPGGMDISGSAAWFAKADMGVTVHRTPEGPEVHVWKCRFKWCGSVGKADLGYDVPTGTYRKRQKIVNFIDQ